MRWILALTALMVAACGQPADTPNRTQDGIVLIELQDGWNCYQGRCFQYHAHTNQIQALGHERTDIPRLAEITNGEVTPRNFLRLYRGGLKANELMEE